MKYRNPKKCTTAPHPKNNVRQRTPHLKILTVDGVQLPLPIQVGTGGRPCIHHHRPGGVAVAEAAVLVLAHAVRGRGPCGAARGERGGAPGHAMRGGVGGHRAPGGGRAVHVQGCKRGAPVGAGCSAGAGPGRGVKRGWAEEA